jgi:Ni,Fe-hydrogenase III large subunit
MNRNDALTMRHCQAVPLANIPLISVEAFRNAVLDRVAQGYRICALFGVPREHLAEAGVSGSSALRMYALLALDKEGSLATLSAEVDGAYPSLAPECPQAHWFEREIHEQWGVKPEGHPWLKPVRFQRRPVGITEFFRLEGAEAHEVAVGPVHAGIIEPGHFRFQCHGENVYHLEISLGYQHRGVEAALRTFPEKRRLHYMETLAGDTTVGHATAYAQTHEILACCGLPPARSMALRGIALELERLANHTGDLGAMAGDVGFLPTASYCGRLRGDFLNLTALLCGNRFGRGMVVPGGTGFDADEARLAEFIKRLDPLERDLKGAMGLLWETSSVMGRFEETGVLPRQACLDLGLVGPAARAAGLMRDVRSDFPSDIFRFAHIPVSVMNTGDVFSRAFIRWLEIQRSIEFLRGQIRQLPEGPYRKAPGRPGGSLMAVSLVEGWRGEICHIALTDKSGRLVCYKTIDPSVHNWMGLAMALRGQQISDFPLCNKSFNLSYCGHDL